MSAPRKKRDEHAAPDNAAQVGRIVEAAVYLQAEGRRLAKEQCAQHGITATQLNVLKLLQEIDGLSLSEVSKRMAAKNSTVTGIVDRMCAAGLVVREQSADDRRVWRILLTDRGRDIAEAVDMAPWDLLRSALHALPHEDLDTLVSILMKVAAHVEDAVSAADQGDSDG